jgi:hypothetical protein
MNDRDDLPELTDAPKMRWQATVSDITAMSAGLRDGTATDEDIQGALNRLLSCDIDRDTLLNAVHIPPDAGVYGPALEKILRRIPDGWGRWISHDAGWYPLVIGLDERLAAIDPDYVVHQVKEKFGTLCYYCDPNGEPTPEVWRAFDAITTEARPSTPRRPSANAAANPAPYTRTPTCSKRFAHYALKRSATRRYRRPATGNEPLALTARLFPAK